MQRLPVGPEEETTELHGVITFSTVSLNAQNNIIKVVEMGVS